MKRAEEIVVPIGIAEIAPGLRLRFLARARAAGHHLLKTLETRQHRRGHAREQGVQGDAGVELAMEQEGFSIVARQRTFAGMRRSEQGLTDVLHLPREE